MSEQLRKIDSGMIQEQQYVVGQFREHYKAEKEPIVLYGIGNNTKAILNQCPDIKIMGLMDASHTGQVIYGKQVLSEEQVRKLKAVIVIVARDSVLPIIYQRISGLEADGVRIQDIRGKQLCGNRFIWEPFDLECWKNTFEAAQKEISNHDVISFDLFDTLIARKMLEPRGLFPLIARNYKLLAKDCGMKTLLSQNFSVWREQIEKELGACHTLSEYYQEMVCRGWISEEQSVLLEKIELELEERYTVARKSMQLLAAYAVGQHKKVLILTDTYYTACQLRNLTSLRELPAEIPIWTSCEKRMHKEDGTLFYELLRETGMEAKQHLHIGDNRIADNSVPHSMGINTFSICSGKALMEYSSMRDILSVSGQDKADDVLGYFQAKKLNDAFCLCESQGRVVIHSPFELGKLWLGPLVYEFLLWFRNQLYINEIEQVLMPARDGYLFKQAYDLMKTDSLPEAIYFKASRRAVSVAAIQDERDIKQIAARAYNGTIANFFLNRFGIRITGDYADCSWHHSAEKVEAYLKQYTENILEEARQERYTYLKYLEQAGVLNNRRQAIFDFVAGGTLQQYLEHLLKKDFYGFYFAVINRSPHVKFIQTAFGESSSYQAKGAVIEHYLMLESVFTDPDATLVCIRPNGLMEFEETENRAFPFMSRIQRGILSYVRERFQIDKGAGQPNLILAEQLFSTLFSGQCVIPKKWKRQFLNNSLYDGSNGYNSWNL